MAPACHLLLCMSAPLLHELQMFWANGKIVCEETKGLRRLGSSSFSPRSIMKNFYINTVRRQLHRNKLVRILEVEPLS